MKSQVGCRFGNLFQKTMCDLYISFHNNMKMFEAKLERIKFLKVNERCLALLIHAHFPSHIECMNTLCTGGLSKAWQGGSSLLD